jgi:hypothetical protein
MPSTRSKTTRRTWTRWLLALGVIATSATGAHGSLAQEPAARVDEQTMAEARRHFQAGVNLLDDPDGARYEEAYHAFHKAYALSGSPKVLGNIGFCSLKLERDGEAIDAYTTYLRDARDIEPRERAQIERDIATLSSTIATFKVVVKNPAVSFVVVDTRVQTRGSPVVNSYSFNGPETTLRVRPGRHSFKVKTSDAESRTYDVSIEPASQTAHEFTFPPPRPMLASGEGSRSSPSYAGPILLGIVGLAAIGTGTATGLMARSKADSIESRCPNDLCPKGYDLSGDRSEAKTLGTIADASFIGGGVALGGALLWALLTPGSPVPKPPRTGSVAAWHPSAGCTARGCDVLIGGDF